MEIYRYLTEQKRIVLEIAIYDAGGETLEQVA